MGVRMNVPWDDGTVKLAKGQDYYDFPPRLEMKLIRTGLAAPTLKDFPEPVASMAMTKAELIEMAEERGIEVEGDDNKADLIRKIEEG